jgi:hypothetical protein
MSCTSLAHFVRSYINVSLLQVKLGLSSKSDKWLLQMLLPHGLVVPSQDVSKIKLEEHPNLARKRAIPLFTDGLP